MGGVPLLRGAVDNILLGWRHTMELCPVGWVCKIQQLLLYRLVDPLSNERPIYDRKQSDDEVPVMLELWRMQINPSLPLLPGPLWSGVIASDRDLTMGQIDLNCILMLNWVVWKRTIFDSETVYLWYTELFEKELFLTLNMCTYAKQNCLK